MSHEVIANTNFLMPACDSKCGFCNAINENIPSTRSFIRNYPSLLEKGIHQVLFSNDLYALMLDVAPLSQDHILLIPFHHFISFAALPENMLEILDHTINVTLNKIRMDNPNNSIVIFEHGMGVIDDKLIPCGSCNSDHAHLHFIPLIEPSEDFWLRLVSSVSELLNCVPIEIDEPITSLKITNGKPYLYISVLDIHSRRKSVLFIQSNYQTEIPSQLMRKILCPFIGIDVNDSTKWHWRDIPMFNRQVAENYLEISCQRWKEIPSDLSKTEN